MAKKRAALATRPTLDLNALSLVRLTPSRMVFTRDLSLEEWEAIGEALRQIGEGVQWWVGDWLAYGEHRYGEKFKQPMALMQRSLSRLANWQWVSRKFDEARRRDTLTFTHHELVAALPVEQQDYWLNVAEANNLNTRQLKRAMIEAAKSDEPATEIEAEFAELARREPTLLEHFERITDEYEGSVSALSDRANSSERRKMADRIHGIAERVEVGRKAK